MNNAIEMRDVSVVFPSRRGNVHALNGLNLTVPVGHVVGFLGPNGAGKTTAMHVLLGFIRATSGRAFLLGQDVTRSIARQHIGFLPEHPDTYRFLTGRELLRASGRLFKLKGRALRHRVDAVLDTVSLTEAADRRIATYSRGMMQRICLGQALINDPDLVILDEPTGGLDPIGRVDIRSIIDDLRRHGKTVFFSSHELSEVELVCDTLIILCRGQIVAHGAASELVPQGKRLEQVFMDTIQQATKGAA